MSIAADSRNVRLWDIKNWELLTNITNIYKSINDEIKFIPEEYEMNEFIDSIKTFGKIRLMNKINGDNKFKSSSILKNDNDSFELIMKILLVCAA